MFNFIKKLFQHGRKNSICKPRLSPVEQAFKKIKLENQKRDARIDRVFNQLNSHSAKLDSYGKIISRIQNQVATLSQKLQNLQESRIFQPTNQLVVPTNRLVATNRPAHYTELSKLSTQEKRILSVLFDHKGTSLSYADISKLLGKSINTVKTQINQLKAKTNLLAETVDSERKKRYKLKENIWLEKFVASD